MRADTQGLSGDLPGPEHFELVVEVFRMLADVTRVGLLYALIDEELPVNELARRVEKAPPTVSQHLAKLRLARLVQTRRQGTQVFYRLENEHVSELIRDAIYHAEHATSGVPEHHRQDPRVAELTHRAKARGAHRDE
jgi:DNA-binding transcriptional ArsR family regulator